MGTLGCSYMIMDATASAALPDEVAATRLPSWALPSIAPALRNKMRADLVVFEGLDTADPLLLHDARSLSSCPANRHALKQRCTVHVVVGYCAESRGWRTLARKQEQHVALCQALIAEGWTLSNPLNQPRGYPVLLLGTAGTIFKPSESVLSRLGVAPRASRTLLKRLHVQAVRSLHGIIKKRRALERRPQAAAAPRRRDNAQQRPP